MGTHRGAGRARRGSRPPSLLRLVLALRLRLPLLLLLLLAHGELLVHEARGPGRAVLLDGQPARPCP
jgi:hypothetical protein